MDVVAHWVLSLLLMKDLFVKKKKGYQDNDLGELDCDDTDSRCTTCATLSRGQGDKKSQVFKPRVTPNQGFIA